MSRQSVLTRCRILRCHGAPLVGAKDVLDMVVGGARLLAIANNFDGSSYLTHSVIYKWDQSASPPKLVVSSSSRPQSLR
jgi:hypothetical protein